ncbi:hypothetical protein ACFFRR_006458 [Megaselia abdita]
MAFSVPSNAEKLFNVSSKKNKNNIDCVNGIRVIFMIWVIFCHSFASNMAVPKINLIDYIKWTRTYFAVLTYNGWISVDSFFYLSELLISWIGMKEIEKRKGWINVPLMYLHRYLRLTPMVAFLMLFAMSLLKFFGNGPFWDLFLKVGNDKCEDNWWMNLLYIQNYAADVIILLFWSHFGITVLVSIVLVLAVESPLIGFERILLVSKKEENVEVVRDEVPKEIKDMA